MARTVAGAAQGRTNRRFLLIAVLLAGLSAVLVYATLSRQGGDTGTTAAGGPNTQVVVARTPIKQRTTITSDMLQLKSVPEGAIVEGAFVNLEDVTGKVTKYPIEANQQLVQAAVVDTSRPSAESLSLVVPTGRRAISITASQVISAGGLILPGDFVDVVWACCKDDTVVSKTLLRNVQVAAVAQSIVDSGPAGETGPVVADGGKPDPEAVSMTLLLTPPEAQQVFLAELYGKLRVSLRGVGDAETPDSGYSTITEIMPVEIIASLPDNLRPQGYKQD